MTDKKLKLAVIGHSRCGKDTVSEIVSGLTDLVFKGSISWHMKGHMAKIIGISEMNAWDHRHSVKLQWRSEIDAYREGDAAKIIREILQEADIVSGIRPRVEFEAALNEDLIDRVIWVERPDIPDDPTLELDVNDADYIIRNDGDRDNLKNEVIALIKALEQVHPARLMR